MKVVVQRVKTASVIVGEDLSSQEKIEKGIVVFIGIGQGDTEEDVLWMTKKIVNLRIFENSDGKMDKSVLDIGGEILIVSQFTLYGDCQKGNRPDFTFAEKPELAEKLYNKFIDEIKKYNLKVVTGKFKSYMLVEINNDGPVTLILEKEKTSGTG